jgi:hypothetical protein
LFTALEIRRYIALEELLNVESHGNLKMAGAIARDEVQTLLAPTSNFHLINEIAEHLYS